MNTADPFAGLDKLLLKETNLPGTPKSRPAQQPRALLPSQPSSVEESTQEPTQEPKQESVQARKDASNEAPTQGSTLERLRAVLQAKALRTRTFRYTEEELNAIRDIVYELDTLHGRKVDKNDVVRIALNWLVDDFEQRKEASVLVRVLASI